MYGILCVSIISLTSVLGVAVVPLMSKIFYSRLLSVLIGNIIYQEIMNKKRGGGHSQSFVRPSAFFQPTFTSKNVITPSRLWNIGFTTIFGHNASYFINKDYTNFLSRKSIFFFNSLRNTRILLNAYYK